MHNSREAHAERLDRQERKSRRDQAEALDSKLREKYGEVKVEIQVAPGSDETKEVPFIKCPDCGGGVYIDNNPEEYPAVKGKCKDCDECVHEKAV